MKRIAGITLAAALGVAGPLSAQQAAPDYDRSDPVTLQGVTETVYWSTTGGKLVLKPSTGSELWEIALPNSKTLLQLGLSAEVLARGAPVKVRVFKARDSACKPNCKAQAVEMTLDRQGKTYVLAGAGAG